MQRHRETLYEAVQRAARAPATGGGHDAGSPQHHAHDAAARPAPLPELTREAKTRLGWMEHYARHRNVSRTCRCFGIIRQPCCT